MRTPRTRAIRIVVLVVCAGGIAGMIVTSALDHNGAAITFGIVTAVAILCQMAMTTALNEVNGVPGAPLYGDTPASEPVPDVDEEASDLEAHIQSLVDAGIDEGSVRD
jgi:hypothetical protein